MRLSIEELAISAVIPTRNRAYTLRKILPSIFEQAYVKQVIVIDDASEDETQKIVEGFINSSSFVTLTYEKNRERRGAPYGRNLGVKLAAHPLILFCDDDAFLESSYTKILSEKLLSDPKVGIASGRLVQMEQQEDPLTALQRFGNGDSSILKTFSYSTFSFVKEAAFTGDIYLPLTQPAILSYTELLRTYPYDEFYAKGNGFREESDAQIQVFLAGYKILMTNDTHTMHMHPKDVPKGGQRTSYFKRVYYSIRNTNYFYKKYFSKLRKNLGIPYPRQVAILLYSFFLLKEYASAFFTCKIKKMKLLNGK